MKYSKIPKVQFQKGASRKRRRTVQMLVRHMFENPGIVPALEEAHMDMLIYGTGGVEVFWDQDNVTVKRIDWRDCHEST